ncbi:MAG TPA: MlaD family protein [Marmoricola sp.]|nr:MlaD family protein [Marmoricola sp.]
MSFGGDSVARVRPLHNLRGILTDRLWLSLIGVIVVLLLTVAYLFNNVLDTPILRGTKTVNVELTSTGGLFEGSSVTYRGVKVGKVQQIRLTSDGVEAKVRITSSDKIPKDSLVKVRSLSPVGEQYLDFQPNVSHGPYLEDGSVIPATSVDLPKTLASTVISVNKLLDQIDAKQLHTLLTELATGLEGTGQEMGKLVDQGSQLLAQLDELWPETDRLLTNGNTVLSIGTDKADDIRTLARSSKQFAAFLKSYDPKLRSTLRTAPADVAAIQQLLDLTKQHLPGFLDEALPVSQLFRSYAPHLAVILSEYAGGLSVIPRAIRNGIVYIEGIPQRPTVCRYDTSRRDPTDPVRRPMVTTGHCPDSAPNLQRGAAHAPGPVSE